MPTDITPDNIRFDIKDQVALVFLAASIARSGMPTESVIARSIPGVYKAADIFLKGMRDRHEKEGDKQDG